MIPPQFDDIGKAAKDLLTKEYNFGKTKLEVKTLTVTGVEFNPILERDDATGAFRGDLKLKMRHKTSGLVFTDTYTSNNDITVKVEAGQLMEGLTAELEGSYNPTAASKEAKVGYKFLTDHFGSTASASLIKTQQVKIDAVGAHEGFVVGGQLVHNVAQNKPVDYSLALGYIDRPFAASLIASNKLSLISASFSHVVSSDVTIGATGTWKSKDNSFGLEFGTEYKLDRDSTIKAKFDSQGKVGLAYIQRLGSSLRLSLGLLVNTRSLEQNAHKIGLGLLYEPRLL